MNCFYSEVKDELITAMLLYILLEIKWDLKILAFRSKYPHIKYRVLIATLYRATGC